MLILFLHPSEWMKQSTFMEEELGPSQVIHKLGPLQLFFPRLMDS